MPLIAVAAPPARPHCKKCGREVRAQTADAPRLQLLWPTLFPIDDQGWDDPDRSGLRPCLGAQNCVFEGLCGPQTYYRLRLDLDGLAGLGVAAHARFTMGFDCTSEVRNDEFARAALAFLYRQFEELFKKCTHRLFRRLALLRQMAHYLRLAHWLCHLVLLSSCSVRFLRAFRGGPNQAAHARHYKESPRATQEKMQKSPGK